MNNPATPAHQLYYGPLYARSYADRNLAHLISSNPATVETMRARYGRYLAGFGSEDMTGSTGYDPRYQGQHIYDLEREDDTFGSGIFDPKGRGGTSNPNLGIFAAHASLPGFIARDVPFTVQRDVTDITDDAAVVSVPAGGMAYIEKRGKLAGAAVTGPTWRPPQIGPPGWSYYDQTYVGMVRPGEHGTELFPGAPETYPAPSMRPGRTHEDVRPVPMVPHGQVVAERPSYEPIGSRSILYPHDLPAPVHRVPDPVAAAAPDIPMEPQVPFQSTVNVDVTSLPVPVAGFGGAFGATAHPLSTTLQPAMDPSFLPPNYTAVGMRSSPGGVFGLGPEDCPKGTVYDIDNDKCIATNATPAPVKPLTAGQLAAAGAIAGIAVAIFMGTRGGRKR